MCPYTYVSNHYNLLNSKKHNSKTIILTSKTLNIVKTLNRYGIISNFIILKIVQPRNPKITIKFNSFSYLNSPFFKKIKTVSTPSKKYYINFKSIKLLEKSFKNSIIILSTNKGLVTINDAFSLGLGGFVVYIIT